MRVVGDLAVLELERLVVVQKGEPVREETLEAGGVVAVEHANAQEAHAARVLAFFDLDGEVVLEIDLGRVVVDVVDEDREFHRVAEGAAVAYAEGVVHAHAARDFVVVIGVELGELAGAQRARFRAYEKNYIFNLIGLE